MPLAKPYQNAYRQDEEVETPPATQDQTPASAATTDPGPELAPEERTYKNRYDNLKAHYDKTIIEARKRENELSIQLTKASRKMEIPANADEFKAWKTQYPDLFRMILNAVREETSESNKQLEAKLEQVEMLTRKTRRDKAEVVLLRMHPDFDDLKASEDFHKWVKEQPAQIQDWLYTNEDDPLLASKAIDLYKAEKGVKPQRTVNTTKPLPELRDAARTVTRAQTMGDPESSQGKIWKTSEIAALGRRDWDKYEAEIEKARREGRIEFDTK